jgi:hypothetical protein
MGSNGKTGMIGIPFGPALLIHHSKVRPGHGCYLPTIQVHVVSEHS